MNFFRRRGKQKVPYEPALARIEGGGIKRGLSAPEASVLLGRPLNLSLTLVLFEMLRKGLVLQQSATPLTVQVAEQLQIKDQSQTLPAIKEQRRLAAQQIPAALTLYEEAFLEMLETQLEPVKLLDFSIAIQPFVRFVAGRVGGYSLAETRAYYEAIIERAPKEARSDGVLTVEREKVFDRNFAWLLMHPDFTSLLDQDDYSYQPIWWRKDPSLVPDKSFATWARQIIDEMAANPSLGSVKIELGEEEDLLSATLMNDIARATFYG